MECPDPMAGFQAILPEDGCVPSARPSICFTEPLRESIAWMRSAAFDSVGVSQRVYGIFYSFAGFRLTATIARRVGAYAVVPYASKSALLIR